MRNRLSFAHLIAFLLLAGLMLATAACQGESAAPNRVDIDPLFRDFYSLRGGEALLGRALGPAYPSEGRTLQNTANAILAFDPSLPSGEKFSFAAVGGALVTADPPLPLPDNSDLSNGHLIYEEFATRFKELGEVRFVGYPLTEVRVNNEQNRIEQYFERLGLYIDQADPQRTVRLLPYGLMACHQQPNSPGCSASDDSGEALVQNLPPEPFLPLLDRLGTAFTGKPLSPVYLAADGNLEQVYENVVLAAPPDNLRALFLRPLPQMVGIAPQPLTAPRSANGLTFIPVENNLGYNVATEFVQYSARHGATEMSGAPTTELFEINGLRRQCFTNYCLDFDANAPSGAQIRPAPLGYDYWRARNSLAPGLELQIWENFPYLGAGETQIIGLLAYNQTPQQPLKDLQPSLTITLPDGSQQNATFPPTSASGTSYLQWQNTHQSGTYKYEICLNWPGAETVCHAESWLVR